MNFVKNAAEGNSKYAKQLWIDKAASLGSLDGELKYGSIEQSCHNADAVCGDKNFMAHTDVIPLKLKYDKEIRRFYYG